MPHTIRDLFKVERLYLAHLDQVCELEPLVYGPNCWSRRAFLNEIENPSASYLALLEVPDRVIGYGGYWDLGEEGHITTLAVSPDYQGRKLGEYIFVHLLKDAIRHKVKQLTLEVRAGNYKAQGLYQKYRFEIRGIRPKYYRDNQEDAVIMWSADLLAGEYMAMLKEREEFLEGEVLRSSLLQV